MQPDVSASTDPIEVWIVEDKAEYREVVQELVDGAQGLSAPHSFGSGEELFGYLNQPRNFAPKVLIVDIGLPGMSGIDTVPEAMDVDPDLAILMLSAYNYESYVLAALRAGAALVSLASSG